MQPMQEARFEDTRPQTFDGECSELTADAR